MTARRGAASLALAVALGGCANLVQLDADVKASTDLVGTARSYHADRCAPVPFAQAEAALAFAKARMEVGDAIAAATFAAQARAAAEEAVEVSKPCGMVDTDGDGLSDVVDKCPDAKEDKDGDRDDDGCPDLDPMGDLDGDGVRNIDDRCLEQPEDLDGDADEDGCPETSEDADGDSVVDALDACPTEPEDLDGFKDADGCPDPDNDLDGLADLRDACPDAPEDLDQWDDFDGCPDDDNDLDGVHDLEDACPDHPGPADNRGCPTADRDGDGVSDATDQCPDAPETRNGYLDLDGCPDQAIAGVRVTNTGVDLDKPVRFEAGTATLTPDSQRLLDEVGRVLRDLVGRQIQIVGHVDGSLDAADAKRLSQQRAAAVYDHLVGVGVPFERLEVIGKGNAEPIDTNRTESGRAANRRIEFVFAR